MRAKYNKTEEAAENINYDSIQIYSRQTNAASLPMVVPASGKWFCQCSHLLQGLFRNSSSAFTTLDLQNSSFRDGSNIVQTTSALAKPLFAIAVQPQRQ